MKSILKIGQITETQIQARALADIIIFATDTWWNSPVLPTDTAGGDVRYRSDTIRHGDRAAAVRFCSVFVFPSRRCLSRYSATAGSCMDNRMRRETIYTCAYCR